MERRTFLKLSGLGAIFYALFGIRLPESRAQGEEWGIPRENIDIIQGNYHLDEIPIPEYQELVGKPIFLLSKTRYTVYTDPSLEHEFVMPPDPDRPSEFLSGLMFQAIYSGNNAAQILPENEVRMPFGVSLNRELYLDVRQFDRVDDLRALSVFRETENSDKWIIMIQRREEGPMLFLMEGKTIVMKIPCVTGTEDPATNRHVTPGGELRIARTKVLENMPTQSAVAFMCWIADGFGIHSSSWWNWRRAIAGFFASHKCINVPDASWHLIDIGGERRISVAEFIFRWVGTNIERTDPMEQEVSVPYSSDPVFQAGWNNVRLIGVTKPEDILRYRPQGELTVDDLREVVRQIEELDRQGRWILPVLFSSETAPKKILARS